MSGMSPNGIRYVIGLYTVAGMTRTLFPSPGLTR